MTATYSRMSPSPRYCELLDQYRRMHVEGELHQQIPAAQTFSGQSLPRHGVAIKSLIDKFHARNVLDYGCGKGVQYTSVRVKLPDGREFGSIPAYWGVEAVVCYDPGYEPFNRLPQTKCDGVICTDVLEHCPEDDMPWIVEELFAFARYFVFANVACYPAKKRLANGENAHCTIRSEAWWRELITAVADRHPNVRYFFSLDRLAPTADGGSKLETALISG